MQLLCTFFRRQIELPVAGLNAIGFQLRAIGLGRNDNWFQTCICGLRFNGAAGFGIKTCGPRDAADEWRTERNSPVSRSNT